MYSGPLGRPCRPLGIEAAPTTQEVCDQAMRKSADRPIPSSAPAAGLVHMKLTKPRLLGISWIVLGVICIVFATSESHALALPIIESHALILGMSVSHALRFVSFLLGITSILTGVGHLRGRFPSDNNGPALKYKNRVFWAVMGTTAMLIWAVVRFSASKPTLCLTRFFRAIKDQLDIVGADARGAAGERQLLLATVVFQRHGIAAGEQLHHHHAVVTGNPQWLRKSRGPANPIIASLM
jgi:hypothetical protein